MKFLLKSLLFAALIFSVFTAWSQDQPGKEKKKNKKDKVKLKSAQILEGGRYNGKRINKFIGNVIFEQSGTLLYCDSAYQYSSEKSKLEAFGNVRIVQGDSLLLTGNRLTYFGDTKKAVMTGNVFLRDKSMTLTTPYLEYDMKAKEAYYTNGGTINDGQSTLTSETGFYNTQSKIFRFKKNVRVQNPVKNFNLESDTLHYNTGTKIATFKGPTKIQTPEGVIHSDYGHYNTVTGALDLLHTGEQERIASGAYTLTADKIFYDNKRKVGRASSNVRLVSEKDRIIIEGEEGYYWEQQGITKITGKPVLKSIVNNDTLFLTADTLVSYESKDPARKKLLAYHGARIYKSDLQGKCDSLAYLFSDSTIYFFTDPVLWSGKNQMTADSINVRLKNNEIHTLNMKLRSFIISRDTLHNYNQVKGRNMTGHFTKGDLHRVDVEGNGESIYFALEKDSSVTGMNKVMCSNMIIRLDSNKVKSISFLQKPDGKFVPPHEILEPERKLKGFVWRIEERPRRLDIPTRKKAD